MQSRVDPSGPRWAAALAWVFLLAHVLIAWAASSRWSATQDEPIHVAGGLAYWAHSDFRIHNENGNLPQRVMALPLHLAGAKLPREPASAWDQAVPWVLGAAFLDEQGDGADAAVQLARRGAALWAVGLGVLLMRAARALGGSIAAACTMAVYAAEPTLIAHGTVATSDVPAAAGFLAVLLAGWAFLWSPTVGRSVVLAAAGGVLALSKHSAVLVVPALSLTFALVGWVHWRRGGWAGLRHWLVRAGLGSVAAALGAWGAIWAAHDFRWAAVPAEHPWKRELDWSKVQTAGWVAHAARVVAERRVFPEAYAYGFAYVVAHAQRRAAFFAGEYRDDGWAGFFPTMALLKTPPVLLLAAAGGVAAWLASLRRRGWAVDRCADLMLPLVLFGAVYSGVSVTSHLNIGHRHLIPLYAVAVLGAGLWFAALARRRSGPIAVVALLGIQALEVHRHHPHHLSYFTPLIGGGAEGWRWAVDSSLDWGQDLPALRDWQRAGGDRGEPVFLAYFGPTLPASYGVRATLLPLVGPVPPSRPRYTPTAGYYVLSATVFQEAYLRYRGGWDAVREVRYRMRLRQALALPPESQPAAYPAFFALVGNQLEENTPEMVVADLELLWLSRLCAYLRLRGDHTRIGYSLLAFYLDADEVDLVTHGPLQAMLETALARRR